MKLIPIYDLVIDHQSYINERCAHAKILQTIFIVSTRYFQKETRKIKSHGEKSIWWANCTVINRWEENLKFNSELGCRRAGNNRNGLCMCK